MNTLRHCWLLLLLISCQGSEPVFNDTNHQTVKLSNLKGQWVVLNYWASWCASCYQEIPELNALANDPSNQIVVLGVNYDQVDSGQIVALATQLGIQFPTLLTDPGPYLKLNPPKVLPSSIIIDPKGRIHAQLAGLQTKRSIETMLTS